MLRLREFREASGLSVRDMCQKLGVEDSRYRKWESGTNGLPLDFAFGCCDIFHCSLDELSGRDPLTLSGDERELLALYRGSNAQGREAILAVARASSGMEGKVPADLAKEA